MDRPVLVAHRRRKGRWATSTAETSVEVPQLRPGVTGSNWVVTFFGQSLQLLPTVFVYDIRYLEVEECVPPSGFHDRTGRAVSLQSSGFLRVWSFHFQSITILLVRFHNYFCRSFQDTKTPKIILRQLLTKICILFVMVTAVLQVSGPQTTALIFELNNWSWFSRKGLNVFTRSWSGENIPLPCWSSVLRPFLYQNMRSNSVLLDAQRYLSVMKWR